MNKIQLTEAHKDLMFKMSVNQYAKIDKIFIHNGHSLFKMNIETTEITPASTLEDKQGSDAFVFQVGHLYQPALNIKTIVKKFDRIITVVDAIIKSDKTAVSSTSLLLRGDGTSPEIKPEKDISNADIMHD